MDSDDYLCQLADFFNGITVTVPSISAIIAIVLAGVLLLASGFASASEIAFFSLSPSNLNDIEERKHPSDWKISKLLNKSERLLATISERERMRVNYSYIKKERGCEHFILVFAF